MKHLIKNTLLFAFMVLNASNMDAITVNGIQNEINKDLDSVRPGSKITVRNSKNKIVYTEVLEKGFNSEEGFDLPNLGQGDYTLEIEHDLEIQITPFRVNPRSVEIFKEKSYSIFKPVINTKDKKIYLSRLNLVKDPVKIKIYDENGVLLHTEKILNEMQMNRIYDFSDLKESTFNMVLSSGKRTFVENIKF